MVSAKIITLEKMYNTDFDTHPIRLLANCRCRPVFVIVVFVIRE